MEITGELEFVGFAKATGMVRIALQNNNFVLEFAVMIKLGPFEVSASGGAGIYADGAPGFAMRLAVAFKVDLFTILEIDVSGTLQLNTTSVARELAGVTIGAKSFLLDLKGKISFLAVIHAQATFKMQVGGGTATVGSDSFGFDTRNTFNLGPGEWIVDFSASADFFGLITVDLKGWFKSNGYFDIAVRGRIVLGSPKWGLSGKLRVRVVLDEVSTPQGPEYRFKAYLSASLALKLAGFTLAGVSITAEIGAQGTGRTDLVVKAQGCITVVFEFCKSFKFKLGTIMLPKPIWLAGNNNGSTNVGSRYDEATFDGVLFLNAGDRANPNGDFSGRGIGGICDNTPDNSDCDDSYIIEHISGDAVSGETIKIVGQGRTQEFKGVKRIVAFAGSGRDEIVVRSGVKASVELHGGDGDDLLLYYGDGNALLYGDGGSDELETSSATTGSVVLDGGDGDDRLDHAAAVTGFLFGGFGNNDLQSAGGSDVLRGGEGDDIIIGAGGDDYIEGGGGADTIDGGDGADFIYGEDGNDVIEAGSGNNVVYGGAGDDRISTGSGNDSVSGGLGFDTFSDVAGFDTLIESQDNDMGLYLDFFVAGQVLLANGSDYSTRPAGSTDEGDHYSSGSIVESLSFIFEEARLSGGSSNNTIVVSDSDNTIFVGGTARTVTPWRGPVRLDNESNGENGLPEHYVVKVTPGNSLNVTISDSGGSNDLLVFHATNQPDVVRLVAGFIETSSTGASYSGVERVSVMTLGGADVLNVRATSTVTDAYLGDGDDRIYVSSLAAVGLADRPDFLTGNLGSIQGTLNIDAGSGRHTLMISDHTSSSGDGSVLITESYALAAAADSSVLASAEIFITGLAPKAITYRAAADGTFADGITIWAGSGADTITVDGSHVRNGVQTVTALNTGLGNESVTVDLHAGEDGMFVLDTQGPEQLQPLAADNDIVDARNSMLSLVVFGGRTRTGSTAAPAGT